MKKLTALLIALITCTSAFSCRKSHENNAQPQNITAEKLSDVAYKRSLIETPESLTMIFCIEQYNNGDNLLILGIGSRGPELFTTDNSFSDFTKLEIPQFKSHTAYDIDVANDGTIVQVINDADYGGLPEPDTYSADYDEELYEKSATYSLTIREYSIEGELISVIPVSNFPYETEKTTQIGGMDADKENILIQIDEVYYVIGRDGKFKGEITETEAGGSIMQIGEDRDGNLLCAVENGEDKLRICRINSENASLEPVDLSYDFNESIILQLLPGTGDYSVFIVSRTTIYGIRADDSSIEPVFSINESGLNANSITDLYISADGSAVIPDNGISGGVKLRCYTECDPAELENIPVITIGTMNEPYLYNDYIMELNDSQTDYRVEIEVFDIGEHDTIEEYYEKMNEFRESLTTEELPDVLLLDNGGYLGEVNMNSMGALCDLYEFIDSDEDFSRESFIPNVLEVLETDDGQLTALPNYFSVDLGYVGKTEFVGDIDEWNVSSFIETVRNLPDGMKFTENGEADTKIGRYFTANPGDNYVDYENMTCNFDSDEFIEFLKFCNEAPSEIEYEYTGELTDEEHEAFFRDTQTAHRENRALLKEAQISCYASYIDLTRGVFDNADLTYLGKVTNKECKYELSMFNEHFAITKDCENKELAWDFIKNFYTDDYYRGHTISHVDGYSMQGGLPVTESGLDVLAENEKVPFDNSKWGDDYTGFYYGLGYNETVEIGHVTDEDIAEVNDIIHSVTECDPKNIIADDIYNLIYEEIERCFNGECSEEDCVRIIQDRVSTYLAEHS